MPWGGGVDEKGGSATLFLSFLLHVLGSAGQVEEGASRWGMVVWEGRLGLWSSWQRGFGERVV